MSRATRFLRACRREPVDCTPIWLMRQAGRYMAEYRALREKHSILDMIRAPELAVEVTLQPVQAFEVDAAILFADILPLLACVGQDVEFIPGTGPIFHNPIRSIDQVPDRLTTDVEQAVGSTLDAVALAKQELDGQVPLIGFSGAPFTLACYAIEGRGSKDYALAKQFMYAQPDAWRRLMELLADAVATYLEQQVRRGADAVQLFDSWAGCLSPHDYEQFVLPYSAGILRRLKPLGVPLIHFSSGTGGMLRLIRRLESTVVGVDWRTNLTDAWAILGEDRAIQGNLDPAMLLAGPDAYRRGASRILDAVQKRPGHIFNLGHGVFKQTNPDHVRDLVDFVHQASRRKVAPAS